MTTPSLAGVRAKLDRADEHLETLDEEQLRFFRSKPYEVVGKFEADVSEWVVTIKPFTDPPLRLSVIVGDALFNLRSALDHLVCALARLNGARECSGTQFPICRCERNFRKREPTWLRGLSDRHRALIEQLQPYHAGEDVNANPLILLADFNNVDKHRVLHPLFGYFKGFDDVPTVSGNRDAGVIGAGSRFAGERRVKGETEIVRLKLHPIGPNPHVDVGGTLVFQPAFGEQWLRANAFPEIAQYVRRVVDAFAPEFG